ncbi:MAG: pyruvate dehydrogenase (acetyl-transferring) E1 component subunit alpha [Deltaproteobacteria bacterium]|nr:pyruvate dehydrogenase (acetyl-transferring) E1 component subunit alpha [Deltaproteobacteria bacterium]
MSTKTKQKTYEEKWLLDLYRKMLLMRRFEEEAARAYTERKIGGFLHLYIGQEAVGLGVISALEDKDYVVAAYRDHGHFLARGGSAKAAMAELYGKETGCSKGRGGSMHFFDAEKHFLGGYGIVGAHAPIAAGAAFAAKYRGENFVTVCFLGEGSVSIGPFHEGLCLAALWKLPVIFIVENNQYSMGTPIHRSLVTPNAAVRADGYPMKGLTVESDNVIECHEIMKDIISDVRKNPAPVLVEFKTYRYRGHSMADPAKYRSKEEVENRKQTDPLILLKADILKLYKSAESKLVLIHEEIEKEVAESVAFAENSAEPNLSTVEDNTYV